MRARRRGRRWACASLGALAALVLAACDTGPSGPSLVSGTVTGDPTLGAVVLDVTWPAVTGFEGRGSTQVYSAPVAGAPSRHRVILVDRAGGDLRFAVALEDARLNGPVVTVVEAVDTSNASISVGDLRVVLER